MIPFLPFYRVGSLCGRVFSRSIVTYFKRIHLANQEGAFKLFSPQLVRLGHYYNGLEYSLNQRFKVDRTSEGLPALSQQLAQEKGIDFFYEIVIYSFLIFFSLIQVEILYEKSSERKHEINIKLEEIRIKTAILKQTIENIEKEVNSISLNYKQEIHELDSKLTHLEDENRYNNYIINQKVKTLKRRTLYESDIVQIKKEFFKKQAERLLLM